MDKKKSIVLFSVILLIILLMGAGTYAYWIWSSNINKNVVFNTAGMENVIVYNEGNSYFIGNFMPTDRFCEGANNTISFYKKEEAADIDFVATINMDINFIGPNIANSDDVYWVVTEGDNSITCDAGLSSASVISYGTFNGKNAGNLITLASNIEITTTIQQFTVWIWIDSNGSNLSSLSGETIDTNIWTQVDMNEVNGDSGNTGSSGVAEAPVLDEGMIPVTISADGVAMTVSKDDSSWYNYENKEWANVVLVKESGTQTRSYYKNNTGKTVNEDDILAYYVWIPRYKYKIPPMRCSEIDTPTEETYPACYLPYTMSNTDKELLINWFYEYFGNDDYTLEEVSDDIETMMQVGEVYIEELDDIYVFTDLVDWYNSENYSITYTGFKEDNYTKATLPVTIDIAFETTNSSVLTGDAVNTYRTHPAFVWDGETVAGIWVGKFETGHSSLSFNVTDNNLGCTDTNCANADGLIIKPNVQSLRYNNVSNFFYASRSMTRNTNPFGLSSSTTDSHMMKNSEWGAVAYLSHSRYGINQEIYINNSSSYYTGRSAGEVAGWDIDTSFHGTYTWIGQEIDESGIIGSYATDRKLGTNASTTGNVTGVYDMSGGSNEYVMGNYGNIIGESGFTTLPDSKYYDLYSSTQFTEDESTNMGLCTLETCGGHALSETVNWYLDDAFFVDSGNPWFFRGDMAFAYDIPGAFSSNAYNGDGSQQDESFRSVLLPHK